MTYRIIYVLSHSSSPVHKIGATNNWAQRSRKGLGLEEKK